MEALLFAIDIAAMVILVAWSARLEASSKKVSRNDSVR